MDMQMKPGPLRIRNVSVDDVVQWRRKGTRAEIAVANATQPRPMPRNLKKFLSASAPVLLHLGITPETEAESPESSIQAGSADTPST